jgi:hypothetical protein
LRSSPRRKSASKAPKRTTVFDVRLNEWEGIRRRLLRGRSQVYHPRRCCRKQTVPWFVPPFALNPLCSRDDNSMDCTANKPLSASHALHKRVTPETLTGCCFLRQIGRRLQSCAAPSEADTGRPQSRLFNLPENIRLLGDDE